MLSTVTPKCQLTRIVIKSSVALLQGFLSINPPGSVILGCSPGVSGTMVLIQPSCPQRLIFPLTLTRTILSFDRGLITSSWGSNRALIVVYKSLVALHEGCNAFDTTALYRSHYTIEPGTPSCTKTSVFFIKFIKGGGGVISVYKNLCCKFCIVQEAFLQQKWT